MLKKCAILGLVLLVLGGLALGWLRKEMQTDQQGRHESSPNPLDSTVHLESYGHWYELTSEEQNQLLLELDQDRQNKTPADLLAEQKTRLRADLDRLASGDLNPGGIAEYLYGPNWEDEVAQHSQRKEQQQITQTASFVCLSIGGTLFGGCSMIWVLGSIGRSLKKIRTRRRRNDESEEDELQTELTDICNNESDTLADEPEVPSRQRKKLSTELNCFAGPAGRAPLMNHRNQDDDEETTSSVSNRRRSLAMETSCQNEESLTAVLLSDEPSQETEWSPIAEWTRTETETCSQEILPAPQSTIQHKTRVLDSPETEAASDPLEKQADNLQEQIAEFRQMAQSVQQATREQSAPLNNTLKELAQQVSAIREYAASQQDRVEKLQEGYDWNIIRTFCLRVIRSLDNIESRITRLDGKDDVTTHLEEVRDELLFALESSGIEQYRPEINSDYRGQEKLAETIRDKETSEDPEQVGKIAKVIRPGYRYMIDEDSAKIVRTAQVKLFG